MSFVLGRVSLGDAVWALLRSMVLVMLMAVVMVMLVVVVVVVRAVVRGVEGECKKVVVVVDRGGRQEIAVHEYVYSYIVWVRLQLHSMSTVICGDCTGN